MKPRLGTLRLLTVVNLKQLDAVGYEVSGKLVWEREIDVKLERG